MQFSTTSDADPTTYQAYQIQGFFVKNTGDFYKGTITKIDYTPHKIDEVLEPKMLGLREAEFVRTDTVFLRELVRGKANLYFYKDKTDKIHFHTGTQTQDSLFELVNRAYRIDNKIGYSMTYRNQLNEVMKDSPEVLKIIKTIDYKVEDLQNLFTRYNGSAGQKTFVRPVTKDRLQLYALVGVSLIRPILINDFLYPTDFGYSTHPFVGLASNIILSRSKEKLSIYSELSFKTYKAETVDEYTYGNVQPRRQTVRVEASYLKLSSGIRYTTSIRNLRPYIMAGLTAGISTARMSLYRDEYLSTGSTQERPLINPSGWSKSEIGGIIGIGTVYKRFSVEGRYERISNTSRIILLQYYNTSVMFIVGYRIK